MNDPRRPYHIPPTPAMYHVVLGARLPMLPNQTFSQTPINQGHPSQSYQQTYGAPAHGGQPVHGYNSGTQYPTTAYTAGTQYPNTNMQYPASQPHGYSHGAPNTMYTSPHAASAYSAPQYPTNYPYAAAPGQYPGQFAPGTIPAPDPGPASSSATTAARRHAALAARPRDAAHAVQRVRAVPAAAARAAAAGTDRRGQRRRGERGEYVGAPGGPECSHCHTHQTSVWRRNKDGDQVCNACGVYQRLRGKERPLSLRKNKVKPRAKHTQNYDT
ncbi:hypothetical protein B0H13DRAFT_2284690 [Mycena leptocephala]|nr:hypothetical protein B0H13DRAFT_2284690 [Mycena leptocephala]